MADARIQRGRTTRAKDTRVRQRGLPDAVDPAEQGLNAPLPTADSIVRYIPTEAVAIYVAILSGAFSPLVPKPGQSLDQLDYRSRWIFLGAFALATAGLVWLLYVGKARSAGERYTDVPVFEMAVASIALVGWAFALPDSPLVDFSFYGGWLPPVILGMTTFLIPAVAAALGRTPALFQDTAEE
jgi:hypothetical protein